MPPSSLHIYRSNRTELLLGELAKFIGQTLPDPMTPECLVVQGRGMALYLMRELSRAFGVLANAEFSYPRNFVQRAVDSVLGPAHPWEQPLERDDLTWLVMAELPKRLNDPHFERVRDFLANDTTGGKRFGLAQRIAQTFDQYLTYRPDLVRAWDDAQSPPSLPAEQLWQFRLWRAVSPYFRGSHLAARELHFHRALADHSREFPELPSRVALFGISTLPPLYVRSIAALAPRVDVRIFLFSPCREFWADLPELRRMDRATATQPGQSAPALDVQPLLSSMGQLGAEFQQVLAAELEALGVHTLEHDLYEEPRAPHTLLGRLQRDVLHLCSPEVGEPVVDPSDRSIALHSCHSAMREVEVLHDQLLALFSADRTVSPRDVIVMTPDVEEYAPFVEAVFERPAGDPRFIPYRIADRSVYRESSVIEALLRILRLVGRRAKASEVLDLLSLDAVLEKLALSADDREKLTRWVTEVNIRWGIDAAHRKRHDQPELELNTWNFGLNRLLLGYAFEGTADALFEGVLPYPEIEGQDAELLGTLADFTDRLFRALLDLEEPRTMQAWLSAIGQVLETLLATDGEAAWQAQKIRSALARLLERAERARFDEALSVQVILKLLEDELDETELARGFLAGGVTFSALVPMRSVPFKIVCLLGMNEGAFPRANHFIDFDLTRPSNVKTAFGPRPGDRSRRLDDRFVFLEALSAARERLLIFFTGQSIRDNAAVPPSVVVSELVDYLHRLKPGGKEAGGSVIRHPLQPFSPRYFDGSNPELFSYADSHAARLPGAGDRTGPTLLFTSALPVHPEPAETLSLRDLIRFFEGPVRELLNRRLRVYLRDRKVIVLDREPWELTKLEEWEIGRTLLELCLSGKGEVAPALVRASGELPPGAPGMWAHELLWAQAEPIAAKVRELRSDPEPSLMIDVLLPGGTRLVGELGERYAAGQVLAQYSRISGKQMLGAWLCHLALCAALPASASRRSFLVGRPSDGKSKRSYTVHAWRPVDAPLQELSRLVELYRIGQSLPLPLFPRTSFELARALFAGTDLVKARRAAVRDEWRKSLGGSEVIGESADPHLQRVFGADYVPGESAAPFATPPELRFEALAERVFFPLLRNLEDGF